MAKQPLTAESAAAQGACIRVDQAVKELNSALVTANKNGVIVGIAFNTVEHGVVQLGALIRPSRLGLDLGKWGTSK